MIDKMSMKIKNEVLTSDSCNPTTKLDITFYE